MIQETGRYKIRRKHWILIGILMTCLFILAALSLMIGNTFYSIDRVIQALIHGNDFTIQTIRLPRLCMGIVCGFAFGLSGCTFQKMFRNPLASPDIIGVTSGAGAAAVFGILILRLNGQMISIFAIAGGLGTSVLIYMLAQKKGSVLTKMILIGLGMQAFLNAITSYFLLRAAQYDVATAMRWLSGSLNNASMDSVYRIAPVVLGCAILLVCLQRHMQTMELGDERALTLGIHVTKYRAFIFLTALILVSVAVSASGPIASISFLAGPITQRLFKGDSHILIPSGMMGILLVLSSDLIAQNFLPARYPVGVMTGLLGAPYLLYMLIRMSRKGVVHG